MGSAGSPGGTVLRLATRESPLALWQAQEVARLLRSNHGDLAVDLVPMTTEGDRRTDRPLSEIGGKGVFAKEVQTAVIEGRADLAVHSAKDLPAVGPPELVLAAVPERGEVRDALVGTTLAALVPGATVATGSARRRVQINAARPGLRFVELRGNMATRLAATDHADAVVVAAVALERLGLGSHIAEVLPAEVLVSQVGQGALAVECRADDDSTLAALAAVEHVASRRAVDAERAFLAELGGDCTLPAGAHAVIGPDGEVHMTAVLASGDLDPVRRAEGSDSDGEALGRRLAAQLRASLS